MKTALLHVVLLLAAFTRARCEDSFAEIPVTAEDLMRIHKDDVTKYQITFSTEGKPTIDIKGFSGSRVMSLDSPAKTASLVVFVDPDAEKKPGAAKGIGYVYFWLSSGGQSKGSKVSFLTSNANTSTSGCKDGVFTIEAKASKNEVENGYSIKVYAAK
jgi:hypothetical protein